MASRPISVLHHFLRFHHGLPFPSWRSINRREMPLSLPLKVPVFRPLQTDRPWIRSPIADGYPSFQSASSLSQTPSDRNSAVAHPSADRDQVHLYPCANHWQRSANQHRQRETRLDRVADQDD